MKLIYDLHSHSTASDGSLSPRELVKRAKSKGVGVLALTDHDNTSGLDEAEQAAHKYGVKLVRGVEVSVTWNGITVHVLGLGVSPKARKLQDGLKKLREFRDWRGQEISNKLEKAGIQNALAGAKKYASGPLIGRTHFALYLVEKGFAKDVRDVFKRYLVHNKPGYVPGNWVDLQSAVNWISEAGGQSVIAHPARYKLTNTRLRQLLGEFKECAGDGLEVVSSSHSADECQTMAKHAKDFNLLSSCGSDYHGPAHKWIELGQIRPLPEQCVPVWKHWNL